MARDYIKMDKEEQPAVLIKIGNKVYCFARGGCKSNVDIIAEALIKGAEVIKDPRVKAHKPQEYVAILLEREPFKSLFKEDKTCP